MRLEGWKEKSAERADGGGVPEPDPEPEPEPEPEPDPEPEPEPEPAPTVTNIDLTAERVGDPESVTAAVTLNDPEVAKV